MIQIISILCYINYFINKIAKMLGRKENLEKISEINERRNRSSEKNTRKNSSIQILRDIMNEADHPIEKPSIKEIKLQEGMVFLNKKI